MAQACVRRLAERAVLAGGTTSKLLWPPRVQMVFGFQISSLAVYIISDIGFPMLTYTWRTQNNVPRQIYSETCLRRPLKGQEKVVAVARWSSYPGSVGHVTISTCDTSLWSVYHSAHTCGYSSTTHVPGVTGILRPVVHAPGHVHVHLHFLRWCADLPCMVHQAIRTFTCTCTVQRGRGWVVAGRVERVVALSKLFGMWMRPWQGKVVVMVELSPYPSGRHYRFYCRIFGRQEWKRHVQFLFMEWKSPSKQLHASNGVRKGVQHGCNAKVSDNCKGFPWQLVVAAITTHVHSYLAYPGGPGPGTNYEISLTPHHTQFMWKDHKYTSSPWCHYFHERYLYFVFSYFIIQVDFL